MTDWLAKSEPRRFSNGASVTVIMVDGVQAWVKILTIAMNNAQSPLAITHGLLDALRGEDRDGVVVTWRCKDMPDEVCWV